MTKTILLISGLILSSLAVAENKSKLIIKRSRSVQTTYYEPIATGQVFQVPKDKDKEELFLFDKYSYKTGLYTRYHTFSQIDQCKIQLQGATAPDKENVDENGFIVRQKYLRIGTARHWKLTSPVEKDADGLDKPVTLKDVETGQMTITITPHPTTNLIHCLEKLGFDLPTKTENEVETWEEVKDTSSGGATT